MQQKGLHIRLNGRYNLLYDSMAYVQPLHETHKIRNIAMKVCFVLLVYWLVSGIVKVVFTGSIKFCISRYFLVWDFSLEQVELFCMQSTEKLLKPMKFTVYIASHCFHQSEKHNVCQNSFFEERHSPYKSCYDKITRMAIKFFLYKDVLHSFL